MLDRDDEYFGKPEQQALMRRSNWLWRLLRDNPRFAFYGRLVALSDPAEDTADVLQALAAVQGASVCYFYPKQRAEQLYAALGERGLKTDRHEHYWGGEAAVEASRAALASLSLPSDLTVTAIDGSTPRKLVEHVAQLCQSCDVMPVPGAFMRGREQRGICLVATDRSGKAVATASSYMLHHPGSRRARDAFWGMLATDPQRRGEKISLLLGARAMVHMWETHGARGFMTGVRSDNRSSQALCAKLQVNDSEWLYASCIDPKVMQGSAVTK